MLKKFSLILFAFISVDVFAESVWNDPYAMFDTNLNERPLSIVEWRVTEDVQKACDEESKRRKLGGFKHEVYACSFWSNDFCLIITSRFTTTHVIGHELRHCFQANFH